MMRGFNGTNLALKLEAGAWVWEGKTRPTGWGSSRGQNEQRSGSLFGFFGCRRFQPAARESFLYVFTWPSSPGKLFLIEEKIPWSVPILRANGFTSCYWLP
jgi:hypothetical protein